MQSTAPTGPQFPTFDDARRVLECVNALHATAARDRMRVLTEQLLDLLGAKVAAIFGGESDEPLTPLHVQSVEPRRRYKPPAPDVDTPSGVTLLPAASVDGPEGVQSVQRESGRITALIAWRSKTFNDRHVVLLQLIHPAVAWALALPSSAGLPAGTEAVLELMRTGLPEKEIARRLGRSTHTIHAHVKRVYRHYAVCSRPELLVRLHQHHR